MVLNPKLTSSVLIAFLVSGKLCAGTVDIPTPPAMPTQVQPQLNVSIDKSTDEITFINTNNDPYVYTKVYKLKYADPYEIRPYLMSAIRSRRIDTNETKVEAIKYVDGTGMVIVSAEQYRFEKLDNGMTIDQVVEMLDRPDLSAQAGRRFFVYYAKYFDATTLAKLIEQVGIMHADDAVELDGVDTVRPDNGMNALLFFCTPISQKNIEALLAQYDTPLAEALFTYTIYEIDSENDGNLGVDFQAWKNGPGSDLFAAGATYLNGWDPLIDRQRDGNGEGRPCELHQLQSEVEREVSGLSRQQKQGQSADQRDAECLEQSGGHDRERNPFSGYRRRGDGDRGNGERHLRDHHFDSGSERAFDADHEQTRRNHRHNRKREPAAQNQ